MAETIEEFVEERGIDSLLHFTRLENLESILENGLLTREACRFAGVVPSVNDHDRYDGTGAISASISHPNYKLFYRLRCNNPEIEWVVLSLKPSLLWRTTCAFSETNAGDRSVYSVPLAFRQGLVALQSMFGDYGNIERAILNIPDHYPTNPQAEVLLLDGATVEDIEGVYLQRSTTQKLLRTHYPGLSTALNGGVFDGRRDHRHWK